MHNTLNKIVDDILEKDTRRKREARVSAVRQITAKTKRITLSGDEVDKFIADPRTLEPASWIKVFFPWRDTLAGRAYTLSGIDKFARTFDIDMVLHGEGPASDWARDAIPGDKLGFAGPCSGGFRLLPQTRWLLLLGDETALPAMRTILASLSEPLPVLWFAEVSDAQEIQTVDYPFLRVNSWQIRTRHFDSVMNSPLVQAVSHFVLPAGQGQVWIACECQIAAYLKDRFINELDIPKTALFAKGYWKKGESNFKGAI
ncbi:siderophore-interacting protein [Serratia plymuthica]|uniref:siderophore-interacting protein n=1 Tax=Serratia TaxID=613 RepID=UPI0002A3A360|nr:siderophore-interacting protein [Serratia plymuthica]ANJ94363.1 ABC transporter ATP-binding protein [Serratia plymuthica]ANK00181.1 ABC transporter ATP-binding protein [Serratia plymuthica]EKF62684.1 FAD-binding 9 siderophore-interacting domain protein [Serratia plymuthica A30]MBI6140291.1 siderophore-interacting protein [Serratia plymuthica]QPS86980.1 siderophore-interacting protein [Serratia plymuthica]